MWIKVLYTPPCLSISLSLSFSLLLRNVTNFFCQAKELDANTEYYIELLAEGSGKSKEEITKDIQRPKYLQAQEAIDYGLADKIIDSRDSAFEKRVIFTLQSSFVCFCCISCLHMNTNNFSLIRITMRFLLNQELRGEQQEAIHKRLLLDLGNYGACYRR